MTAVPNIPGIIAGPYDSVAIKYPNVRTRHVMDIHAADLAHWIAPHVINVIPATEADCRPIIVIDVICHIETSDIACLY
jgi:hypothetical protein